MPRTAKLALPIASFGLFGALLSELHGSQQMLAFTLELS
jgi:hypothetical protein